jgi:diacylglycerol kinase family enzyme
VAIQRNPVSGAGPDRDAIVELVRGLSDRGIEARLFSNRDRLRRRLDDPRWRDGLVCIVAAGGDGTVGDVVNRYPGLPLAILPLGTENLLARYLGIPRSGEAVAEMIATGHRRTLDLGRRGDRSFTLMASAGFDAEVVHRTHAGRSGHITRMGYLKPILQSLRGYGFPPMRVFVDRSEDPIVARLVFVAIVPAYARGLRVADSAVVDDGLLDLRLFERGSVFQMLRYFARVLTATHERLPDVRVLRATRVRIESDTPVPIQVDGDPAGRTPVEIEVLPRALEVFVPGRGV